jgi:hypothetical protein
MTPGQQYRAETITVPKANFTTKTNGRLDVEMEADWVYVKSAAMSNPSNPLKASLSFNDGPALPVQIGMIYPLPFEKLSFVNTDNNNTATVTYVAGVGDPPVIPPLEDQVYSVDTYATVSVGANSYAQLFGTAIRHSRIWLSIPTGEAGGLYIQDEIFGAGYGLFLPVGFPIPMRVGQSLLYAKNTNASAVTISFMPELCS